MKTSFRLWRPILSALIVAVSIIACSPETEPTQETVKPIKIFTVEASPLAGTKEYVGRAAPSQSVELSFRVSGRLVEVPVRQGDTVVEGQVVARLDRRDIENREKAILSQLEQAQAILDQMTAGARPEDRKRLEAMAAAREAEFEEASATFDRYQQLMKDGVVSQQDYDQVKARVDTARANLESARQEQAIGEKGARDEEVAAQQAVVRGLQAQLKEVRDALSDTDLKAPFAGNVARIYVDNYEDIQAKQPILALQNISRIDVIINVSENVMARGRQQLEENPDPDRIIAMVSFPALGEQTYPVRVKEYQTEADPQTQSFEVVLEMDQPEGYPVQPGMNAIVRGEGEIADGMGTGFFVPVSAVVANEQGDQSVWVIDPETMQVSPRVIETGGIWQDRIQVTAGLSNGEKIAASAAHLLRDGMKVEPARNLESMAP